MTKLPERSTELTRLIKTLDRKKAGFSEKTTSLLENLPRTAAKTTLKDLAIAYASIQASRTSPVNAREAFSDFAYRADLTLNRQNLRYSNNTTDSAWSLIFDESSDTFKIDKYIKDILFSTITGYGNSQNHIVVQFPKEGSFNFRDNYSIEQLLYKIYQSPFGGTLLVTLSMFKEIGFDIELSPKYETIKILGSMSDSDLISQLTPVFTKIFKANASEFENYTSSELEHLKLECVNTILESQRTNHYTKILVDVEKPFRSRVFDAFKQPLTSGRADIAKLYIALALLDQTLDNSDLFSSVSTNISQEGFRLHLLERSTSLEKYAALLHTTNSNNVDLNSLDIWAQVISDEDIVQAVHVMRFVQDSLKFILDETQPLNERIEAFDADFDVDTTTSKLSFHGLPLGFTKHSSIRDAIRKFITDVQISVQETVETSILPTLKDLSTAKRVIAIQEKPLLAAYIKFADKVFDIWIDPLTEDSETQTAHLVNPINNKTLTTIEMKPEVATFADLNGLFADELLSLFGKVVA